MAHEHDALMRAHQDGSDPMQTVSAASFLALQGQSDANLALAERDTREAYLHEFDVLAARIAGTGGPGLLDDAMAMDERTDEPEGVAAAAEAFDAYRVVETTVRGLDDPRGNHDDAVELALKNDSDGLAGAAAGVNERMAATSDSFEQHFTAAASDARLGSDLMVVVLALVLAVAVASVLVGVQPRIGEYR
jgi:hypothetical protein